MMQTQAVSGIMSSTRAGVSEISVARKPNSSKKPDALSTVKKDFDASWQYAEGSWHKRWEQNYALYHNRRVNVGYDGISNTFVPMTFSTIETMVAALFGGKPRFNFTPPNNKPDQNTEILNSLLADYWDRDKWNIKVINWGRGMLMLGTSVIYVMWCGDHPQIVNVPIRDFFIDPTASSLETARYVGRRYLTTIEELKSYEVVDHDPKSKTYGEMIPKYKSLDKVPTKRSGDGSNTDKEEKDMFYGSTIQDPNSDQVEVIEYWTKDRVISVANRSVVIEDTENYFKERARAMGEEYPRGIVPFAVLRDYVDESLFYATGEVDYIKDEQEMLNDITNQNIDSVTYSLNQMYTLDPKYADHIEEVENLPGAVYPFEANALRPIEQRPIPADAFNERLNLKNEIRETTASNEIVKGVGDENTATATEINAQIAGAGQRLALKVTQIENEGFHQLAQIVLAMVKLYITQPFMVKVIGKTGVSFETFDPNEFAGEYEPRVQLESTVKSQKAQMANQGKELLAMFLDDPYINQLELRRLVFAQSFDLDPDEVEILIQEQQPMDTGDPMMGATDPGLPIEGMTDPLMEMGATL